MVPLRSLLESAGAAARSGAPTWAIAVIGVGGVVLGALVAGGFRIVGDKVERRSGSQRAALYAVQEAALKLRITLQRYGRAGARPDDAVTQALDRATGRFDLLVERVSCETVRESSVGWLEVAQRYWTDDPGASITHEESAWRLLQRHVGEELRRLDD